MDKRVADSILVVGKSSPSCRETPRKNITVMTKVGVFINVTIAWRKSKRLSTGMSR
jgi:hypothetical protein